VGILETEHRRVDVDGIDTFYRVAGPADAPVLLLPHGYPCSSFEFRHLMPPLADRWRTVAPDAPGFGYTAEPDGFGWTFQAFADWLQAFARVLGLERYVIWLHDYGSQFGFELALRDPARVRGLVVQNGDIYADEHGPKYAALKRFWAAPSDEGRRRLADNVSEAGFRDEFVGEIPEVLVPLLPPDLWKLHWSLMDTPSRRTGVVQLFEDQRTTLDRFAEQQRYLQVQRPPTLIVWGSHDGYMPAGAARAYLRDQPDADLHLLSGGHWLLETHLTEVVPLVRRFLSGLGG
jgi:pimeloyl-ACP methyl ester carboxylesterase